MELGSKMSLDPGGVEPVNTLLAEVSEKLKLS